MIDTPGIDTAHKIMVALGAVGVELIGGAGRPGVRLTEEGSSIAPGNRV